jgi:hypothetical protein
MTPTLAASDHQLLPCAPARAIGMPKLKATPSAVCGTKSRRLA